MKKTRQNLFIILPVYIAHVWSSGKRQWRMICPQKITEQMGHLSLPGTPRGTYVIRADPMRFLEGSGNVHAGAEEIWPVDFQENN